jgi:hypothetical protein
MRPVARQRPLLVQRTSRAPIDTIDGFFADWLNARHVRDRSRPAVRFLMTINGGGRQPDEALYAEMRRFVEELTRAGVLLATGGLDTSGTRVQAADGKVTLIDGPYAEAKETIVSFALIDVRSKEEAFELARRFWAVVKDGSGDLRQVFGPEM